MNQSLERFEAYYTHENDEGKRGHRDNQGIIEFLTTERYMKNIIPPNSKILDACAGCGVYSFFLAGLGHIVTAGDLVAHNVREITNRQAETPVLHQIYHGSATELGRFDDASFDVVLNMGAFYHITDKEEREKSITECLRVLKPNGLFFLAYLNKFSNIVKYHGLWKDEFSAIERILERGFADDDSLFYQSTPEEVEALMTNLQLAILHNVATDGFKGTITQTLNSMDDALFDRYLNYHFKTCEIKSILGYSEHALVICRK